LVRALHLRRGDVYIGFRRRDEKTQFFLPRQRAGFSFW
jgi:hypothetical protein